MKLKKHSCQNEPNYHCEVILRKGGGKQKGAAFERLVCKQLSLWLSKGKNEDLLWRSAMSGGRSTVGLKKGNRLSAQAGDISAVHKRGHRLVSQFMIECKTYKTLNYERMVVGKGKLIEFWNKAREEAAEYNKLPLLVAKQNQLPTIVCISNLGKRVFRISKTKLTVHEEDMHVLLFEDFLKLNPKLMRKPNEKDSR